MKCSQCEESKKRIDKCNEEVLWYKQNFELLVKQNLDTKADDRLTRFYHARADRNLNFIIQQMILICIFLICVLICVNDNIYVKIAWFCMWCFYISEYFKWFNLWNWFSGDKDES